MQFILVGNHNIEGLKQVSSSKTCFQPNMAKFSYGWLPFEQVQKNGEKKPWCLIILRKIKICNFSKNGHIFYTKKITLLKTQWMHCKIHIDWITFTKIVGQFVDLFITCYFKFFLTL